MDNAHEFLSAFAGHSTCPPKEDEAEVLHFQHTTPEADVLCTLQWILFRGEAYEARPMLYDLIADVHSSSSNSQAHAHVRAFLG